MIKPILALLAGLTLTAFAGASDYLTIGDPAPKLSHVEWLKGSPDGKFEKGRVYVVEFWATWCGPCKANIPNLTALAKKYAGSVSIAGIDIWETSDKGDTTFKTRVSSFVKTEGDKMAYTVGVDDLASDTANTWMKAAGEGGIPMSFVVGKDGKIAWMGHAQGLDEVLASVVAGNFDVAAARARRATEVEVIRPVKEAMDAKQFSKAIEVMDAIIVKRPEMARYYQYDRYTALAHLDLAKTKQLTDQVLQSSGGEIGAYQMICSVYATQPDLSQDAYRFGQTLIEAALAKKDREYLFLSMAGAISMSLHEKTKAIGYAKSAVEAAEKDVHAPKPFVEFLKRTVQTYESAKS